MHVETIDLPKEDYHFAIVSQKGFGTVSFMKIYEISLFAWNLKTCTPRCEPIKKPEECNMFLTCVSVWLQYFREINNFH